MEIVRVDNSLMVLVSKAEGLKIKRKDIKKYFVNDIEEIIISDKDHQENQTYINIFKRKPNKVIDQLSHQNEKY